MFFKKKIKEKEEGTYHKFINKSNNLNDCSICLEKMKLNEKLIILYCSHIFHEDCILSWFNKKKLCPLCDKHI